MTTVYKVRPMRSQPGRYEVVEVRMSDSGHSSEDVYRDSLDFASATRLADDLNRATA